MSAFGANQLEPALKDYRAAYGAIAKMRTHSAGHKRYLDALLQAKTILLHQVPRHHGVDALVAVDQLRYAQVAGEAAKHVGLL
jgi:hypothetical protein